jgi:hypothetical protein
MLITLYGLPGSGRHKFEKSLDIDHTFCDDFENVKESIFEDKNKIHIITMFSNNSTNIIDKFKYGQNFVGIIFNRRLEEILDQRYNEFFGLDIRYLYHKDPFLNFTQDLHFANLHYLIYNYRKDFSKKIMKLEDPEYILTKNKETLNMISKNCGFKKSDMSQFANMTMIS